MNGYMSIKDVAIIEIKTIRKGLFNRRTYVSLDVVNESGTSRRNVVAYPGDKVSINLNCQISPCEAT